jgi:hypothetical protein
MPSVHQLYASLAPWLGLSFLLLGRNRFVSRTRFLGSLLLAFFLLCIPFGGWPLVAWIRTLEMNPSFTLTGLILVALWQRFSGRQIFREKDWLAAWMTGALAALILYPMGLGLTRFDPYSWGWGCWLPIALGLAATMLLLLDNRFGIILILPLLGSLLQVQESTNLWNALVDPFYGGGSLIAVMVFLSQKRCHSLILMTNHEGSLNPSPKK